jgi:polyamine oxidase
MLAFFFGGHSGDALERISDERVVQWLHAVLKRCLLKLPGTPKEEDVSPPSSSFVTHWRGDPLSRGTYSYLPVAEENNKDEHANPVHLIELSRALWDGRLGFAGEHTEVDHYATVHGPAISGWREADRVHALLKGAWSNVWTRFARTDPNTMILSKTCTKIE